MFFLLLRNIEKKACHKETIVKKPEKAKEVDINPIVECIDVGKKKVGENIRLTGCNVVT